MWHDWVCDNDPGKQSQNLSSVRAEPCWLFTNAPTISSWNEARAIEAEDKSASPHIPQIIFYQSGLGLPVSLVSHFHWCTNSSTQVLCFERTGTSGHNRVSLHPRHGKKKLLQSTAKRILWFDCKNFWQFDTSQWLAGATGLGIVDKIKDAYEFIVHNWIAGDEIL